MPQLSLVLYIANGCINTIYFLPPTLLLRNKIVNNKNKAEIDLMVMLKISKKYS